MSARTSARQKTGSALLIVGFLSLMVNLIGVLRGRFRPEEFDPAVVVPVSLTLAVIGVLAFAVAFALPPASENALTVSGAAFALPALALGVVVFRAIVYVTGEYTRFSDQQLLVWLVGVALLCAGSVGHGIRAVRLSRLARANA